MAEPSNTTSSPSGRQSFSYLIKRRRAVAMASGAMSLAGCGSLSSVSTPSPAPTAPSSAASADPRAVAEKVKAFTSDIDLALDRIDQERLRSSAGKKNNVIPANNAVAAEPAATAPASVILASAGDASATPHTIVTVRTSTPQPTSMPVYTPPAASPTVKVNQTPIETQTIEFKPVEAVPVEETLKASAPAMQTVTTSKAAEAAAAKAAPKPLAAAIPAAAAPVVETAPVMPVVEKTPVIPSSTIEVMTPTATPVSAMGAMSAVTAVQPVEPVAVVPVAPVAVAEPVAPVVPAVPVEPSVEEAIAVLKKNVNTHPTLSTALAMALLDNASAGEAGKGLSEADQKVYTDLLDALDTMKTAGPGSSVSDRAAPLVNAAQKWQAEAELTLPRLVLATRVDSFGVFSAVDPVFEQGKRHTVIIYCEVANFASKKGEDGWYSTHLTQQETLMTEDKLLVWRPNAEEVEDRSMNQRHDFYLVKKLTIPENLAAGKYTLVMNVADKIGGKKNIVTLPIEIK